jgi:uncharacterized protein (DUF1499 family)
VLTSAHDAWDGTDARLTVLFFRKDIHIRSLSGSSIKWRCVMKKKPVFSLLTGLAVSLAVLSGLGAVAAGLGTRWGLWDFRTGLTIFRGSAYGAVSTVAVSAIAILSLLRIASWRSFLLALVGLIMGTVLVTVSWNWEQIAKRVPPIHDITTDTTNPPKFVAIVPLQEKNWNSLEYGGPAVAKKQHNTYPDIAPLLLAAPLDQTFDKALSVAKRMDWIIIDANKEEGRIEAVATTFWFGFKDDIVIRIEKSDSKSRVDIRSVSRVGVSDLGTNAKRIREFLRAMKET